MWNTPNRHGNPVRTQTAKRALTAFAVTTLGFTVACGGGPSGTLYDLIAEASENADVALGNLEDARAEIEEATSAERVPPCANSYVRPEGMHWRPRYADTVPVPEGVDPDISSIGSTVHRVTCRNTATRLENVHTLYERSLSSFTEFDVHADTMREAIDRMNDDAVQALAEEIEAIAAARPDEDTFRRRFERLRTRLVEGSPLVREVGLEAESRGVIFALPVTADDAAGVHRQLLSQVDGHLEAYEASRQYLQALYDYRRQTYEGPDVDAEP